MSNNHREYSQVILGAFLGALLSVVMVYPLALLLTESTSDLFVIVVQIILFIYVLLAMFHLIKILIRTSTTIRSWQKNLDFLMSNLLVFFIAIMIIFYFSIYTEAELGSNMFVWAFGTSFILSYSPRLVHEILGVIE